MALRCSPTEVKELLDTTLTETQVLPFLLAASLLLDTHLINAGLSVALMRELERWLAAHFVCIRDPLFMQASTDGQSMTFQRGPAKDGLKATSYGQQVLLLDPTGILALVTSTKRASIKVD
jgi:hypothetical protein